MSGIEKVRSATVLVVKSLELEGDSVFSCKNKHPFKALHVLEFEHIQKQGTSESKRLLPGVK